MNTSSTRVLPAWVCQVTLGFLYWIAFLLVLEPDNVLRARQAGHPLTWPLETLRIGVAGLLGAPTATLLLYLTRRFPVTGSRILRHATFHLAAAAVLSVLLILISCVLVAWALKHEWVPDLADLSSNLTSNGLLLVYALCSLSALAHVIDFIPRHTMPSGAQTKHHHLDRVTVKQRGRISVIHLIDVDWIETLGNYLALHVGASVHLIRETSVAFEAKIDPALFVRIHRRAIVAIDRIKDLQPIANGDALLRLTDGQELNVSRSHRKTLVERWEARSA
ncbi:MAG: LytTR family transcriptional regulator [Xanthomonadaceae bacterium]|nr:LytTR family transcriptional regulator [Xanthomonadaceae bacterium]